MKRGVLTVLVTALGSAVVADVAVAQQGAVLEEVVVTARRYQESISDAPLAVAVMSNDFLETNRVDSIQDILELTPGANWGQFAKAQPSLALRGINGGSFGNSSIETAVQVVHDGIPLTKAFMMTTPVYDLERVEIMRGPQGTTFGRNATLGILHFVTARPSQEFSAGIDVSAGTLDLFGTTGYITGGLTDTVSGRLAFNYQDTDGNVEDADTGEALEGSENFSIRGSLLFEPSDTFTAYLKAEFVTDEDLPQVRRGNDCAGPWLNVANYGGYTDKCEDWTAKQDTTRSDLLVERDMAFLTAELTWALGDKSLTWLSGYQDGQHDSVQDAFGTPFTLRDQTVSNDATVLSTEVRLDNFASGNRVRWLIGASYADDEEDRIEQNVGLPERQNLPGTPVGGLCGGQPTQPLGCPEWNLFTISNGQTSSLGIFGEVAFDMTDRLTLVVGGRYSDDSRDYVFETNGWGEQRGINSLGLGNGARDCNANAIPDPDGTGFMVCGTEQNRMGFNSALSRSWDDFAGKVSLSYALNDNNNIYALYSEAFKAGGFQHDSRNLAHLTDNIVENEDVTNYELGWKGSYDRARFAITLFNMELTDAQINNNVPAGPGSTGNVTLVVNAAGIENTGIELEGTFAITDSFTVGASLASYDNKFLPGSTQGGTFDPATNTFDGEDVSGTRPNNAPEETYAIYGEYVVALGNGSSLRFRADLRHRSDVWQRAGEANRDALNIAGTRPMYLRPELDKLGAHISWTSASENLTIAFWGRNLDNEMDFLNSGPGIGSIFNRGQAGPLGNTARSRPVGVAGREQMGVTASFSF